MFYWNHYVVIFMRVKVVYSYYKYNEIMFIDY